MDDLIERLRDQGKDAFAKQYSLGMWKLCEEAASAIERLRAALDRYALHDDNCVTETWHGKGPMRCSCGFYEATEVKS